jgi:hypothetical protein
VKKGDPALKRFPDVGGTRDREMHGPELLRRQILVVMAFIIGKGRYQ